ncbi:hypothetical protein F4778DRAFT_745730 [Xylariomycetidae sp. FL2044]|nr:hypothetical protein F4778DRAFT_745730 [Xylariomycetidae sp. FL2044]
MATTTAVSTASTRINLGPLTTAAWDRPSSCDYVYGATDLATRGGMEYSCGTEGLFLANTKCWPPRTTVPDFGESAFIANWIYSPGIMCPTGYTAVVSATQGGGSDFNFLFSLEPGETALGCCPTGGYSAATGYGWQSCLKDAAGATEFVAATCITGSTSPVFSPFTLPGVMTGTEDSSTSLTAYRISAAMYQVVHKREDIFTSDSTSTSSPSSPSPSSTTIPAESSGATSPSSGADSQGSGLSTGAIAGIAIAAVLVGILLSVAAFCLCWRRRRRRHDRQQRGQPVEMDSHQLVPGGGDPIMMGKPPISPATTTTATPTPTTATMMMMKTPTTAAYSTAAPPMTTTAAPTELWAPDSMHGRSELPAYDVTATRAELESPQHAQAELVDSDISWRGTPKYRT